MRPACSPGVRPTPVARWKLERLWGSGDFGNEPDPPGKTESEMTTHDASYDLHDLPLLGAAPDLAGRADVNTVYTFLMIFLVLGFRKFEDVRGGGLGSRLWKPG